MRKKSHPIKFKLPLVIVAAALLLVVLIITLVNNRKGSAIAYLNQEVGNFSQDLGAQVPCVGAIPTLRVVAPSGGQTFAVGSTVAIQLQKCNLDPGTKIAIKLKNTSTGATYQLPVSNNIPNNQYITTLQNLSVTILLPPTPNALYMYPLPSNQMAFEVFVYPGFAGGPGPVQAFTTTSNAFTATLPSSIQVVGDIVATQVADYCQPSGPASGVFTDYKFAATASGGTGHYVFTWNIYKGSSTTPLATATSSSATAWKFGAYQEIQIDHKLLTGNTYRVDLRVESGSRVATKSLTVNVPQCQTPTSAIDYTVAPTIVARFPSCNAGRKTHVFQAGQIVNSNGTVINPADYYFNWTVVERPYRYDSGLIVRDTFGRTTNGAALKGGNTITANLLGGRVYEATLRVYKDAAKPREYVEQKNLIFPPDTRQQTYFTVPAC